MARAMALKEFKFFISVLVPRDLLPRSRTERFTSARMEPSWSLQSEIPRYFRVVRSLSK